MATADLRPGVLNVRSVRGDTIALPVTIQESGAPADLTGRTFTAQLRRIQTGDVVVVLMVDTADAAEGILVLGIDSAVTAGLSGNYVWDLEQDIDGAARTILAGEWMFDPDVTRQEMP